MPFTPGRIPEHIQSDIPWTHVNARCERGPCPRTEVHLVTSTCGSTSSTQLRGPRFHPELGSPCEIALGVNKHVSMSLVLNRRHVSVCVPASHLAFRGQTPDPSAPRTRIECVRDETKHNMEGKERLGLCFLFCFCFVVVFPKPDPNQRLVKEM